MKKMIFFIMTLSAPLWGESSIPSKPTAASPSFHLRDPTQPGNLYSTDNTRGAFRLNSILVGKTRRLALINDTLVQVGDTIDSARVISINEDSVVIADSGKTITLYLYANDIRK